jgi:hypothetical protein
MKKFLLTLVATLALSTTFAQVQDTLLVYNVDNSMNIVFEAEYPRIEVDSILMKSTTAFIEDAELLYNYYFDSLGIDCPFWQDAVIRYIHWPEIAESANEQGDYYHPESMIFVPDHDYVNAIVFDWSEGDIKIAIFAEDGLWTTDEPLGEKWEDYISTTFANDLDFNNYGDESW